MPLLALHGEKVRYRELGRAGASIVFIHGAGASSAVWLGQMHRLARHRRVVALDLPGHGRSTGRATSIEAMRDCVGAFAAARCLGSSLLVGHSMGGLVAMACAVAWPDKVAGLALVATAAQIPVSAALTARLENDFASYPSLVAEMHYSPETPAELRRRGTSITCLADQATTLADYRAVAAADLRGQLGALATPTLVISGAHDLVTPPKAGAALAAAIAGARHITLEASGHMPMHEEPDELAQLLAGAT